MKHQFKKYAQKSFQLIVFVLLVTNLPGCKDEDNNQEPSQQDVVTANLSSGIWKVQSVTVDGTDKTSIYSGLTLTFTSGSFATTNGGPVWPATGTWTFTDNTATTIKRNDGLEIQLQEVNISSLKLGLVWATNTLGSGRSESVKGQHVFTFGK